MKKLSTVALGAALLSAVIYAGCKKDTPATTNTNTNTTTDNDYYAAQDEANASFVLNDSKNISDGAAKGQSTEKVLGGACGTITADSSATTDSLDIHFTGTCPSPDGRYRSGDIIVYWTKGKGYFDSAASITQTWRNYSVSNPATLTKIAVSGLTNLKNTGKDSLGDHSWSYSSNVTLTYSGGTTGTSSWSATRNNVLTRVGNVWYYYVSGSATGTDKNGTTYTLAIKSPLVYTAYWINLAAGNAVCGCIEAGSETLTRTGKPYPLTLTYTSGVGNCDYTANATINGTTFAITVL